MTAAQATICKGCWEQMKVPVPLRGPLSMLFRAFGIRPSRMNPNLCTICELSFTKVMRARKIMIDATILFADLRGYTALSQSLNPDALSGLLDVLYDACACAIWEQDGLLNKTIGDAVMAVFNFPVRHGDHATRALHAARAIQHRFREQRAALDETFALTGAPLGIGIGINTGQVSFGEFGQSHRDVTAIGTVVNAASRAQSVAESGQILVTRSVFDKAQAELAGSSSRDYALKGFADPIALFAA
jgi:adenylate cyclase